MRQPDREIFTELRRWMGHEDPWLRTTVLRERTGIPDREIEPALSRLVGLGVVVREMRVGVRGGVYKALPTFVSDGRAPR